MTMTMGRTDMPKDEGKISVARWSKAVDEQFNDLKTELCDTRITRRKYVEKLEEIVNDLRQLLTMGKQELKQEEDDHGE